MLVVCVSLAGVNALAIDLVNTNAPALKDFSAPVKLTAEQDHQRVMDLRALRGSIRIWMKPRPIPFRISPIRW
jgi:hypothetical protein